MNNKSYFWGLFLIIIGILLGISRVLSIPLLDMDRLWPMFVLIPGLCFNLAYFSTRKGPGVLVPGGILTTIGLLFFFETMTNWSFSEYTWPVYPLAVAIGLFQLYIFGNRSKGLLIPIGILSSVSIISFTCMILGNIFNFNNNSLTLPAILIIIGIGIILNKTHS